LDEQQAIVCELDGINRLIDLQEEQLREYDRLAQSLFYTTFGDPVSNPKGWEVKKLGEVAVIRDGSHNPPKGVDEPTEYRMLSSQNIFDNLIDYSKGVRYLSKENFELEHKRTNLKAGDVLLTIVGTIGRACIVTDKDTNITLQRSVAVLSPKDDMLSIYLNRLLFVIGEKLQYESRGVAQKGIYLGQLSKTQIPVPPLALQQTFAAQIEAIEQQKALVRRSLDETRTLLAARMQYYFE
jgi:type I restriction enzyme S subunit